MKSDMKSGDYVLAVILVLMIAILSACSSKSTFSDQVVAPTNTQTETANNTRIMPLQQDEDNYIEVIYFHRTQRCYSCQWAGDGIEWVVNNYFGNELKSGRLVFKTLDVQDKANVDIVDRYGAYTSSMYINKISNGIDHIEEVAKIMLVIGNDDAFIDLVKSEIEKRLA